jgi:translation elongation factor EF-Ts
VKHEKRQATDKVQKQLIPKGNKVNYCIHVNFAKVKENIWKTRYSAAEEHIE